MKIVIVDDDKAIRAVLRSVCEGAGHEVVADFGDGMGLLEHVATNRPDVVCLDYNLPGINGLDVLVELDAAANHVDVIMITGSDDPELKGRAADLGARGFIRKPFEQAQILAELKDIDETRRIAAKASAAPSPPATALAAPPPGKIRANSAVIIDDSGAVRHLLKGILEGMKVHVTGLAAGAKEGLSLVAKLRPAMVLLDVEMPGMTGIEVLPQLRQASPGSAVVIVTGNASRAIVEAAAAGGAKGYFLKPVRPAKVEELVKKLLLPAAAPATKPPPVLETFAWTEAWSVGVPGLDRDHQHMVDIVNRLSGSMADKGGNPRAVAQTLLSDLADYGQRHFQSEEAYMRKVGYKGIEEHILEHKDFVEKVGAFTIAAACGVLDPAELYRFLSTWLRDHVHGSDMLFRQTA